MNQTAEQWGTFIRSRQSLSKYTHNRVEFP